MSETDELTRREKLELLARETDVSVEDLEDSPLFKGEEDAPMETKNTTYCTASVKDVDLETQRVTGYFASWATLDADNERIDPTAFEESIQEQGPESDNPRIKQLYQHRPEMLLGMPDVLKSDDFGLYFETEIIDTRLGKDVLKMYQADLLEHSVGFIRKGEELLDDGSVLITKAELMEGSAVTWGANPNTPFLGFKSEREAIDYLAEKASALRYLLGEGLHDVRMEQVELGLKKLESDLRALKEREEEEEKGGNRKKGEDDSEGGDSEEDDLILKSPDVNFFKRSEEDTSTSRFFPKCNL